MSNLDPINGMETTGFVWPHSTVSDTRTPLFTFDVNNATYGFYLFSVTFWLDTLACMIFTASLSAMTGILVYYTMVEPRKDCKPGPPPLFDKGFLAAFGLILPLWILAPIPMLEYLNIQNMLVRFLISGVTPTIAIFRTTEALFGFTPSHAKESISAFCFYFGSIMLLRFDGKTQSYIPTSPAILVYHCSAFCGMLLVTGLWQSAFFTSSFFPTLGDGNHLQRAPDGWYDWSNMISLTRWKDTLLVGFLFLFYLTVFCEGFALLTNLATGIQTERMNVYPLTASKSPSDFWGRRWNRIVHALLKNGVYKPVRCAGGSNGLASLAAFTASGVFHEQLLPTCILQYEYAHGFATIFFLWHALLVIGDRAMGHWPIFQFVSKRFPAPVQSALVLLLGLPIGHFFIEPYVNSDFFVHGNSFFPMVLPVSSSSL